jgi:hypothetical protein
MVMFHDHMIILKVKYSIDLFSMFFCFFNYHRKRNGFRNLQYHDVNTSANEDTYLLQGYGLTKNLY